VLPVSCPRCARPQDAWTIDLHAKRAGCPCGEVIELVSDELEGGPLARTALSTTPRRPAGWREQSEAGTFQATLKPGGRVWTLALGALVAPIVLLRAVPMITKSAVTLEWALALTLAIGGALAALTAATAMRRWTFRVADGRLSIAARGESFDLPLEDVLGFFAERAPGDDDKRGTATLRLSVVRTNGDVLHVPLVVRDDAEAQFIADRLTHVLATGGHEVPDNYRGARVALDEPEARVRVAAPEEEEEATEDQPEPRAARK
jgi:hypothetical protein